MLFIIVVQEDVEAMGTGLRLERASHDQGCMMHVRAEPIDYLQRLPLKLRSCGLSAIGRVQLHHGGRRRRYPNVEGQIEDGEATGGIDLDLVNASAVIHGKTAREAPACRVKGHKG